MIPLESGQPPNNIAIATGCCDDDDYIKQLGDDIAKLDTNQSKELYDYLRLHIGTLR